MCAFHAHKQQRLLDQKLDVLGTFRNSLLTSAPWDSIIEFATSDKYCGKKLYPRQETLLRLIFLETEQMSQYDLDTIDEWTRGFKKRKDVFGVQPDVWDRVQYLKDRGYRRFPHILSVLGRRASKGMIGGVLGAEQIAYFYSLDDWQAHYGIDAGQDGYLSVVATNQSQAQRFQFADIRRTVENCKYLQPNISTSKESYFSIRTPADVRQIAELKGAGIVVEREIATLRAIALSSNSSSGRGAVGFANFFDEFAFMVQGTGSTKSGEEIYEAWQPSLDQFGRDALTYIPSSPFCLSGDTPVLTEDLRWVRVDSLRLGDRLIGFDEFPLGKNTGGNNRRTWQPAVVTETSVIRAPRYKMVMQSGKTIVCTGEHLWLCAPPRRAGWRKTKDIKPGDRIRALNSPLWSEDDSWEGGYLAGFFDAEGHLGGKYGHTQGLSSLGYGQNAGAVQVLVERLLKERGFQTRTKQGSGRRQDAQHVWSLINGGAAEMMRFLGTVRPERLLKSFPSKFYGGAIHGAARAVDIVASVEYLDEGEVIALGTSTNTLVAEGLLSHNTKIGKFFELYKQGSVLMESYTEKHGRTMRLETEQSLNVDAEGEIEELTADPEMLVFQGPSWILYQDWERGPELVGVRFKRPVQPDLTSEVQQRRQKRNPEKFKVERLGQFAEVQDAYLDPDKVDEMFVQPEWRDPLEPQDYGRFDRTYRIHCDPGRTNANFALAVGHLEDAPPDEKGDVWPHVIIDYLKVWKPGDYPDHTVDYVQIQEELDSLLTRFPSTTKISFDQWNSASFLANIRRDFSPNIRVVEEVFTDRTNQTRCERFKSALNLGWVHSYLDHFGEDGTSLLETECKFLTEKNGKVIKQDFGPCTTKDLFDAVCVVTTDLLHHALDRWVAAVATAGSYGSSDISGLKSGREFERIGAMNGDYRGNIARELLQRQSIDRTRDRMRMTREPGFPTRGRVQDPTRRRFR